MPITPFAHVPRDIREWTRFLQAALVTADTNASLTDADIPATIARDTEVAASTAAAAAALAAHVVAADPHPTYTTAAELSAALTNFTSGTYTPTLTNTTNVAASTPRQATYLRVGNSVTVAGQIDIDPTGAGQTVLGLSLPVASAFTTAYQLGGAAACPAVLQSAAISADSTNDRAQLEWLTADIANQTWTYTFTYQVI